MAIEQIIGSRIQRVDEAVAAISNLVATDSQCRSGILGLNDQLEITTARTFAEGLQLLPSITASLEASTDHATAIIAFDLMQTVDRLAENGMVKRLAAGCEATNLTLLDVMVISESGWNSLRQKNLL